MTTTLSDHTTSAPIATVQNEYEPLIEGAQIVGRLPTPMSCPTELTARHKLTERLITQNGLTMPFLGYAPVFSGTKVYPGKDSDWALMNLSLDPLFGSHGNNLYAPVSVINEVQHLTKTGVNLDAIFIAHEVPKGAVTEGRDLPIELITPAPSPKVQRRLDFLDRTSSSWWNFITRTSVGTVAVPTAAGAATVIAGTALIGKAVIDAGKAVASASAAAEAAAERSRVARARAAEAAAAAQRARYDPALLGVQFDPQWIENGQPIGLWYFITAWLW